MNTEYAREYCSLESSANDKWQKVVDMADKDQEAWIKELEYAHRMLIALGLKYSAHLLAAADMKVTAEMFRIAAKIGDQND